MAAAALASAFPAPCRPPRAQVPGSSRFAEGVGGFVEVALQEAGARGSIGVGIPGALSPASGRIKNANSTWIIGQALDRDLERLLSRPVRLENDANCFALSEAVDGAGAGAGSLFGVIPDPTRSDSGRRRGNDRRRHRRR